MESNKKLFIRLSLFLAICTISLFHSISFAKEAKFHLATTNEEKRLDSIIRFSETKEWDNLLAYIKQWPHTKPQLKAKYTDFFTKEFIYTWSRTEKYLVDEDCEGKYIKPYICGLDFNPITCAQDQAEQYYYNSIEQKENYAIIEYSWTKEATKALSTFKLVKSNGVWLLDSSSCLTKVIPSRVLLKNQKK